MEENTEHECWREKDGKFVDKESCQGQTNDAQEASKLSTQAGHCSATGVARCGKRRKEEIKTGQERLAQGRRSKRYTRKMDSRICFAVVGKYSSRVGLDAAAENVRGVKKWV